MSKLVSKQLVDFVKSFEGFSPTPYFDEVGVKTLGYGMTGEEINALTYVTEGQASNMLENILNDKYAAPLKISLDSKYIRLNQNQFDALVSMAYNVGVGAVLSSTLYKNICAGVRDVNTITSNFTAWSKATKPNNEVITLPGLLRRRKEEAAMFFGTGNTVEDNPKSAILSEQIKALQYNLNLDYNAKIQLTGYADKPTIDALKGIQNILIKGHKSHVIQWLQQKLIGYGYLKNGQDTSIYDEPTFQAVTNMQKNWGRPTDGILRIETWNIFLNN